MSVSVFGDKNSAADDDHLPKADHTLDATGLFCPEPVMLLHNVMRTAALGQVVEVIATDPSTNRDIPKFCNYLGHDLLNSREKGKKYVFLLRKGEG